MPSSDNQAAMHTNDNGRRLAEGTELSGGRYTIEKLVASGGMGAVYRAVDMRFHRPCAVKEMLDEFRSENERTQSVEWFGREATFLLDLNHPYIPRVRDFFMESGKHYLVMDFIEGRTLAEVLERDGTVIGINGARGVPEHRARSWAQQLCNVLAYLHQQSPPVIFRDLKPSNIMVTNRDEIRLIDFGIARTVQTQGTQATVISTYGYAPPEQLLGEPETRSDLFSLGATIHRVLTQHDANSNKPNLFAFPPVRLLRPDVSVAFEQIIMKALAYKAEYRWSSAVEMENAIRRLPPVTAIPPTALAGSATPQRPGTPLTPHGVGAASGTPPPGSANGVTPGAGTPSTPVVSRGVNGPAGMYLTTALAHVAAGRIEAAYPVINQANVLEPNNALVHKLYGQVFARRQPPQSDLALKAYTRSLELNPEDAETHKLLADVFFFLRQQPHLAIPEYIRSLNLNVKDAETHQRLAQCYERTGQLEPGLNEYIEAAKLAKTLPVPQQLAIQSALGLLAMRTNRFPIAEQAFVQVLFLNPADHQTRFLLSQVYERENKLEDAFRECSYVVGPLAASNPVVSQLFQSLRARLGR